MVVGPDVLGAVDASDFELGLERIATLSRTAGSGPVARIQQVIDAPDGSDRLYAVDTRGLILAIEDGEVLPEPVLDLRGRSDVLVSGGTSGGEYGLRSFAFHPDFANPDSDGYGVVYTTHSAPTSSRPGGVELFETFDVINSPFDSVLAEWRLVNPADPVAVDPTSKRELIRIEEPFGNHNLNQLLFNPNAAPGDADYGRLYVSVGDGGAAYDPTNRAQDLDSLTGKVLRIEPLAQPNGDAYGIPDDNPFVGRADARPEIWASGFRNPQTMSFDVEGDGRLFIGDIGQDRVEEVNVGIAGGNYGWDVREGPVVIDGRDLVRVVGANEDDLQYPFTGYDHGTVETNAGMAAGFVYRGDAVPELAGQFLFADFPTGRLFVAPTASLDTALADGRLSPAEFVDPRELVVQFEGSPVPLSELMGNAGGRVDARLATDAAGELYVFGKQTGEIFRFVSLGGDDSGSGEGGSPPPATGITLALSEFDQTSPLVLNGSARMEGGQLQLTPAAQYQVGSAYYLDPQGITADTSITTDFAFSLDGGIYGTDGFVFVLQNAPAGVDARGDTGGDQGLYPSVTNSLAISFDTYSNWFDRPGNNHVEVIVDGNVRAPVASVFLPAPDLNNGSVYRAWMDYDGPSDRLEVFLASDGAKPATPVLSTEIDLDALVGGQAYAGFTAATGGGQSTSHTILDWNLSIIGVDGEPVNQLPSITSPSSARVSENTTLVIDVQSSDDADAEGAGLTYRVSGGIDRDQFEIDPANGVLRFADAPNFEAPADADRNNRYDVEVTVTDSRGASRSQSLDVAVDDVAEASDAATSVEFIAEDAGFSNTLGWYDPTTGAAEILFVDSNAASGFGETIEEFAPEEIELFLIPDGAANFAAGGRFAGADPASLDLDVIERDGLFLVATAGGVALQGRPDGSSGLRDLAYFTETGKNPDGYAHARAVSDTVVAWEDISASGDADFNDLTVSITPLFEDPLV